MSADRTSSNEFETEGEPLDPRKPRAKSERDAGGDRRETGGVARFGTGIPCGSFPTQHNRLTALLSLLYMWLRNGFPGNPGETYVARSKSRIGGYRSSIENDRTHVDLEKGEDRDPSQNQRAIPFRFRGKNDLRECERSSPMRIIISHEFLRDVETKNGPMNGNHERESNLRVFTKVVKSLSRRPSPMNSCPVIVTRQYRP